MRVFCYALCESVDFCMFCLLVYIPPICIITGILRIICFLSVVKRFECPKAVLSSLLLLILGPPALHSGALVAQ